MRAKRVYPVCAQCSHRLDPTLEDDCERYYIIGGEIYCKYCFEDWAKDWLDENMDELAGLIGVPVVQIGDQ